MRIKRIKLKNFIGIRHGMEKDEIEINFTDSPIVMLQGGNGSGKSTILSQLHPFAESYDDRKKIIEPGTDGLKEIDIEHKGNLYTIQHHYPAKPAKDSKKTFIQKNGVELNESGRFREAEVLIEKELGITTDYFKIGRIGSNTKNFVDLQTSDRKNYISKFLNIDDLLAVYEVVKNKSKDLATQLKSISDDLKNLETKEVLDAKIKSVESALKLTNDIIDEYLPKKGSLEATLTRAKKDIGIQDVNAVRKAFEALEEEYKKAIEDEINLRTQLNLTSKKEETQEKRDAVAVQITALETKIQVNNTEQNNLKSLVIGQKNKLYQNNNELASMQNEEDVKKIQDQIQKYQEELAATGEKIRASEVGIMLFNAIKEGKRVSEYIEKFKDFTDFIEKYFTDLIKSDNKEFGTNLELFLSDRCESVLENMTTQIRTSISEKRKMLEDLRSEQGQKLGSVCHLENLKKRPTECNIDSCPFIKDALKHKNVKEEIVEIDGKIKDVSKDLEAMELTAENLQETINRHKLFEVRYGALNARDNIIYQYFLGKQTLVEKVAKGLADFQAERQNLIDLSRDTYNEFENYKSLKATISGLTAKLENYQTGDAAVKNKIEADNVEIEKELEKLNEQLTLKENEGKELSDELLKLRNEQNAYDNYLSVICNRDCLSTKKCTAKANLEKLEEYTLAKTTSEAELADVVKILQENMQTREIKNNELQRLKVSLGTVVNLTKKFDELSKEAEPLEKVNAALDPKTGIPLIFIKLYLEETEAIANALLDVAYNGDFNIKFHLSEKDFRIEVIAKDNVKEDIRLASQGEMALTTISISLALIQQSIGEYNILCLDEIDGPLDAENRENFLGIVNSQLNKLGTEQVFVISHNNAFDTAEMDLILLPRHSVDEENTEFMKNKKVIFRYN